MSRPGKQRHCVWILAVLLTAMPAVGAPAGETAPVDWWQGAVAWLTALVDTVVDATGAIVEEDGTDGVFAPAPGEPLTGDGADAADGTDDGNTFPTLDPNG